MAEPIVEPRGAASDTHDARPPASRRLLALLAAVALLNASLAFHNIWPTPAVAWRGELSIEVALVLLAMVAAHRWFALSSNPRHRRGIVGVLSGVWTVLVLGHYVDVTTPALYGREINLYFDLRFMPDVAAMIVRAAPLWLVVVVIAAVAMIFAALYFLFRWAFATVAQAVSLRSARVAVALFAATVLAVFAAQRSSEHLSNEPIVTFATPVVETYVRQARLVIDARAGTKTLPPTPPLDADLASINGADVFLVFIEAYGAAAYERSDMAPHLAPSRAALEAAIQANHQDVVSAFVESPTFGGSSWLAHLTLMSGIEVRDAATNASLMSQPRDSLVTVFANKGYRTVALMPGLRQRWPEGAFYRFDEIYGAARLDYQGPEFGWFAIPDEYSLARLDVLEAARPARQPLFLFYPTISTHFPFSPTPPYQPDWPRMLTRHPYDGAAIVNAYAHQPDWTSFAPGYVDAVSYTYATLGGYLSANAQRDRIYIILGDHQPAAAVSGEGAPWDVPVHVVASTAAGRDRAGVLDRLSTKGFRRGLTPSRPSLGPMHTLLPVLLDAFSSPPR